MKNYEGIIGAITVWYQRPTPKDTTIQSDTTSSGFLLKSFDSVQPTSLGHVTTGVFRASWQDPALYAFHILLTVGEVSTIFEQEDFSGDLPSVPVFVEEILWAIVGLTQGLIVDIKRVHRARVTGECPDEDGQMATTRQAY
ncbi:hypothetical protein F5146DRAFT_1132346 [Armillaria mellea]|nr:hypothetical protein F5146DRAFT_1132346 [Armillaria mellea]